MYARPVLDRDQRQRVDHAGFGQAHDRIRRRFHRATQALRDRRDGGVRAGTVEIEAAGGEVAGIERGGDQLGVGHGGRGAAAAVAARAGVGPGTGRADPEPAGLIEPGDRAAARADLHDIDHRHPDRKPRLAVARAVGVLGGHARCAALDGRALRGRAADIEIDQVVPVAEGAHQCGPADACRRPRFQQRDRMRPGPVEAGGAAVRLHRHERRGDAADHGATRCGGPLAWLSCAVRVQP